MSDWSAAVGLNSPGSALASPHRNYASCMRSQLKYKSRRGGGWKRRCCCIFGRLPLLDHRLRLLAALAALLARHLAIVAATLCGNHWSAPTSAQQHVGAAAAPAALRVRSAAARAAWRGAATTSATR